MVKFKFAVLGITLIGITTPAVASEGSCPAITKLEAISGWDEFKNSGPYDANSVTNASAFFHKDKRTHIVISNAKVSAQQVAQNITKSQVSGKGMLALDLILSNSRKSLINGEYSPKNRFGKMGVKTTLMLGSKESAASGLSASDGIVKVSSTRDNKICGTFDLVTPYGPVKGEFVAPLEQTN